MKLATYFYDDGIGPGAIVGQEIVDLRQLFGTVRAVLECGEQGMDAARGVLATSSRQPLVLARLRAPIEEPRLFIGVGLNYRDHAAETGRKLADVPTLFAKLPGSAASPYQDVGLAPGVDTFDYEGELGFVIGRTCRDVQPQDAPNFIAGFVVVNDLTVRALSRPETLILAKSGAGYGPVGPWITTIDDVPDPHSLGLRTWVNGEIRQNGSTSQMHWNCWQLLSYISAALTLQPGDVLTTGSPAGSGIGRSPPLFLKAGDCVRVEIETLGAIENHIVPG